MNILVLGSSGFIGSNLVERLIKEGHGVRGVDIKDPQYVTPQIFIKGDLRDQLFCEQVFNQPFDRVYQLAADMGGAGFIFTGENDANVMHNSAQINLNVAHYATLAGVKQLFFSSSACVYPDSTNSGIVDFKESDAYPANPDNDYGWEKLFSERVYQAYHRNKGLNIRIARFHNTFGPYSTWDGGREKAPAAICRKVIEAKDYIEMWGDGEQTRSFTYIDETLDGIEKLMQSNYSEPLNIGSNELITINNLARMCMEFKGEEIEIRHVDGPVGMRDRNSDNTLVNEKLGWRPTAPLKNGMEKLYRWIESQKSVS
jgi:GDP-D-mannose 3',5'-epimerase